MVGYSPWGHKVSNTAERTEHAHKPSWSRQCGWFPTSTPSLPRLGNETQFWMGVLYPPCPNHVWPRMQYFNSEGQGSLVCCSLWDLKESDTTTLTVGTLPANSPLTLHASGKFYSLAYFSSTLFSEILVSNKIKTQQNTQMKHFKISLLPSKQYICSSLTDI